MGDWGIGSFCMFLGIVLGISMPGAFSRPWFEKGIFLGDKVVHVAEKGAYFYSACKNGRVVYKENDSMVTVRWSECEGFPKGYIMIDTHQADQLRLK